MMAVHLESQCDRCVHYNPDTNTCKAYNQEIPFDLRASIIPHTKAFEGDNGVRYELNPKYEGWEKDRYYQEMIQMGKIQVW